ncbi:acyl carrier protein [Inquilinus limosus]|uniref:acyl carrier protein n=1 Tax=Inquilinus limosus TaxID=171674 RepID=UPI003F14E57A
MDKTFDDVQQWLVIHVARLLEVSPDSIDVDEEMVNLGLTSRQAVTLTADLETYLSRPTDPALIWEYPTIRQLAQHLGRAP